MHYPADPVASPRIFLYYVLMIDLAVFNNKVSTYVLVFGCMIQKVLLYVVAA